MKAKLLDFMLVCIIAATALPFYFIWVSQRGTMHLHYLAYFQEERPYVYRVLVPAIARGLAEITRVDVTYCMMFVFALSAVGLFYSLKYLYMTFRPGERAGLFAFVSCGIYFSMMLFEPKVYDLATGAFFALSLGLLARGKFNLYYLLFPLATLNRETTFLLAFFFAVYYIGRLARGAYFLGMAYQIFMYVAIRVFVMGIFADSPGSVFWFRPLDVIRDYLGNPFGSLALLGVFVFALWLVAGGWDTKPIFLRLAFLTIFPVVLVLHFLMGYAFEIRVLAEAAPVVFLLATYYSGRTEQTKPARRLWSQQSQRSLLP